MNEKFEELARLEEEAKIGPGKTLRETQEAYRHLVRIVANLTEQELADYIEYRKQK